MSWTRQQLNKLISRLGLNNAELAESLGITRERVRQLREPPLRSEIPERFWPTLDELDQQPTLREWTPDMLRELRATMGWTLVQAAEATGISRQNWCTMENGRTPVSGRTRRALEPFYRKGLIRELIDRKDP